MIFNALVKILSRFRMPQVPKQTGAPIQERKALHLAYTPEEIDSIQPTKSPLELQSIPAEYSKKKNLFFEAHDQNTRDKDNDEPLLELPKLNSLEKGIPTDREQYLLDKMAEVKARLAERESPPTREGEYPKPSDELFEPPTYTESREEQRL